VSQTETAAQTETDHVDRCLASSDLPPEVDLEVEGIVDRISGLQRRIHRMLDETLADHGLSVGEWKLLGALRQAPDGRRSAGGLAKRMDLSSGAMTNRLDRLEAAGFVRRVPDATDRRSVQVELTDEGGDAWTRAVNAQGVKEALIASALTQEEKEHLNGLLRRLMLEFERREIHP
jgi:DNA-binding MarR family transcriptional regulator